MHVILLAPRIPRKGRAAKDRQPVARRGAIGAGIDPDVPIGLGARAAGAALGKERVLVGAMVLLFVIAQIANATFKVTQ